MVFRRARRSGRSSTHRKVNGNAARHWPREKDKNLAWWNYPVPPEDELWLFIDTVTGLPVKPEMHNAPKRRHEIDCRNELEQCYSRCHASR